MAPRIAILAFLGIGFDIMCGPLCLSVRGELIPVFRIAEIDQPV